MILTVSLPEPYHSALAADRAADVADARAESPWEQYGRGLARGAVGRADDARRDLRAAQEVVGDPCRVELAHLDLRRPGAAPEIVTELEAVLSRTPQPSLLAARARHILGLAEFRRRRDPEAVESLLIAARLYGECSHALGRAQVLDSLGMVQAAAGRPDDALHHYTLSLALKAAHGDRFGIAITLGNIGRIHLQCGRLPQALESFRADLELAEVLHDARGKARVLSDIGRTCLAMGAADEGRHALEAAMGAAETLGLPDVWFFAAADLVLADARAGRTDKAALQLESLRTRVPAGAEPLYLGRLHHAEGAVWAARGDHGATERLESAVATFEGAALPADEIAARLTLARHLLQQNNPDGAEEQLIQGLVVSRRSGWRRDLAEISGELARAGDLRRLKGTAPATPGEHLPADTAARFVLRTRLGAGGFGDVYRVYDATLGIEAALKLLRLGSVYDPRARARLVDSVTRELHVAMRVHHPGLVRVHDVGLLGDDRLFVVQDFIPGRTLDGLLRAEGDAPFSQVFECLSAAAYALAELHRAGVLHRDLKPSNVMIRPDGSPVLLDYGVAVFLNSPAASEEARLGTLPYMSPEQARGGKLDARSDLYSLGVVAYEWLAGIRPLRLHGADVDSQISDLQKRPPAPLKQFRPDVSVDAARLVMALLEKRPAKRPATAIDVGDAFRDLAASASLR